MTGFIEKSPECIVTNISSRFFHCFFEKQTIPDFTDKGGGGGRKEREGERGGVENSIRVRTRVNYKRGVISIVSRGC